MPCAFHAVRPRPFHELGPGCQFEVQELDLIDLEGVKLCPYHASLEYKNDKPTEKSGWSSERIVQFYKHINTLIDAAREKNNVCDLTGVVFPGDADFSEKEFPEVCFFGAKFGGIANFYGAQFSGGDANFDDARFSGGTASFLRAKFNGGDANFVDARFGGNVTTFQEAEFSGGLARFIRVKFNGGSVIFSGTQFSGGDAHFYGAQFSCGYSGFENTKFSGFAYFSAPGGENKEDSERRIFREVHFFGARFEKESNGNNYFGVTFENRWFLGETNFKDCYFASAPQFHGCTIHQNTTFPSEEYFKDTESACAAQAYRTLKLAMENARDRNNEAMFYALEQKSLRNQDDTPKSVMFASYLYEKMSDYGRDFMLPLGWLAALAGVFFLVYMTLIRATAPPPVDPEGILKFSLGFTLDQLVLPFRGGVGFGAENKLPDAVKHIWDYRLLYRFIGAVQSIGSISLIALFLLALRRRFKMD